MIFLPCIFSYVVGEEFSRNLPCHTELNGDYFFDQKSKNKNLDWFIKVLDIYDLFIFSFINFFL
jgi:hypothetical protein